LTIDIKLLNKKLDCILDIIYASGIKNDRVMDELYIKYYDLMREAGGE
jgi:hypothetical protein